MTRGAEADWWNEAIASWFFNEAAAGQLVYLGVDDQELERVAIAAGRPTPNPREAFTAAMQEVSSLNDPFGYWWRRTKRWEQLPPPRPTPPFVCILALTALMADDATRSRWPGLYDTVRRWWGALNHWLLDLDGQMGLPTAWAPTQGFRSVIGHAWSQVLVRRRDRTHFAEFFSTLGAPHGPDLALDFDRASEELFVRWRTWIRRGGSVSERLRHLVDDPAAASSEEGRLLGRILADELCHWDGTTSDPEHRPSLRLVVVANTFARRPLYFAAPVPAELAGKQVDFPLGAVLLGDEDDLTEVPLLVTSAALSSGVRLDCSGVSVTYAPRAVVPMARRGPDFWRSVEHLQPGEEAYALVARSELDGFGAMAPDATPSTAVMDVPQGWNLFKDAEVASEVVAGSAHLAGLVPRSSALPHLTGGLRLGSGRKYLAGGPPDVVVPEAEGITTEVVVDGQVVALVPAEGGRVRLATLGLLAGEHSVIAGCRRFNVTLEPFDWWQPPPKPAITRPVRGAAGQDAIVAGALVEGITRPPLVLVPVRPELFVLGKPGQCHRASPASAPWVRTAGLPLASFEPLDRHAYENGRPFPPYWVAWVGPTGPWKVMACGGEPELRPDDDRERLDAWARLVQSMIPAEVVGDDRERRWWASYSSFASSTAQPCRA
jgi:hypothetical protein